MRLRTPQQFATLFLSLLLLLLTASTVRSTILPGLEIRYVGIPEVPVIGQPYELELDLIANEAIELESYQVMGEGWKILDAPEPTMWSFDKAQSTRVRIRATPSDLDQLLVLKFRANGVQFERALDLSSTALELIGKRFPLQRIEGPPPRFDVVKEGLRTPPPAPLRPRLPGQKPIVDGTTQKVEKREPTRDHQVTLTGNLSHIRVDGNFIPADGVTIRIYDEDWDWDEHLGTTITDATGHFSITVSASESEPDLYFEAELANGWVEVGPPFFVMLPYIFYSQVYEDYGGGSLDFGYLAGVDVTLAVAMGCLSDIVRVGRYLTTFAAPPNGLIAPKVSLWFPEPGQGVSFYDGSIHIKWGAAWNESTHIHEYGHHWIYNHAIAIAPEYCDTEWCNRSDGCGHCAWCEEVVAVAWSEGFPNWLADVTIRQTWWQWYQIQPIADGSFEYIGDCNGTAGPCGRDPWRTEGFATAALRDLEDNSSEIDDGRALAGYGDVVSLSPAAIFYVTTTYKPIAMTQFYAAALLEYPQFREQIWETAMHDHQQIDLGLPQLPTGLVSLSHVVGDPVGSADATLDIAWTAATDDASGIAGYVVNISVGTDADPGSTMNVGPTTSWTSQPLPTGTWFVNIRSVDRAGHLSAEYTSIGPLKIRPPYPADLTPKAEIFWALPVVPRPGYNPNPPIVEIPTELIGDANTYWNLNCTNIGETALNSGFAVQVLVDGVVRGTRTTSNALDVGEWQGWRNQGPIIVRPGRHTFGGRVDSGNQHNEHIETNNLWARQWIWRPDVPTKNTPHFLAAPPRWNGGFDAFGPPPHYGVYANQDGLRMSVIPLPGVDPHFGATAIHSLDNTEDYNAWLHEQAVGVSSGFATPSAESERGAGELDAVIINGNVPGANVWDVGVVNPRLLNPGTANYAATFATGQSIGLNSPQVLAFEEEEMLMIREFHVSTGNGMWLEARISCDPSTATFQMGVLGPGFTYGALDDVQRVVRTDANGEASINWLAISDPADHAIIVFRDPRDGRLEADVTLELRGMIPDFSMVANPGWESSLIPAPDPPDIPDVFEPTVLNGGGDTYLNFSFYNDSPDPMAARMRIDLDGTTLYEHSFGATGANTWGYEQMVDPLVIGGGRHTLTALVDPDDLVPERDETNNNYGKQYAWRPATIGLGAQVRSLPDLNTGGWEHVDPVFVDDGTGDPADDPAIAPMYYNCDGVRTPRMQDIGFSDEWLAIATIPDAGVDVDVQLHDPSNNVEDAFGETLAFSGWPLDASDFVLINHRQFVAPIHDVGVVKAYEYDPGLGANDYALDMEVSQGLSIPTKRGTTNFGPFTIPAGEIIRLHHIDLPPGSLLRVAVIHQSGAVNWGLSYFSADEIVAGKSDALASHWQSGVAEHEMIVFFTKGTGRSCIAVWKKDGASLGEAGQYMLEVDTTPTGVDEPPVLPVKTALKSVHPNPFNPRTTIAFDLARDGDVYLTVFNLRGEKVRTLVAGPMPAGQREVLWTGVDDAGSPVVSGVYVVQLRTPEIQEVRKVTLAR